MIVKERNTVIKSIRGKLRVALVFPNLYRAGIANLGMQILYDLLNSREDIYAERFYLDVERSVETRSPLSDFDVIAFSWQFELDAVHILEILRRSGIAIRREERGQVVIAGGPCCVNPSPLERFVDAFFIGEAEAGILEVIDAVRGREKGEALEELAQLGYVFVPGVSEGARRVYVRDLDAYFPVAQVLSEAGAFGRSLLVEVARGCSRGCRFCMGGYIFRPRRERSIAKLEEIITRGIEVSKPERIALLGASVTDHSRIDELAEVLRQLSLEIATPSLRADTLTRSFVEALAESGQRSITLAPEACEQLRYAVNKDMSNSRILAAARLAAEAGIRNLKLYYILGFPGEGEEHIRALADEVKVLKRETKLNLRLSVNPLIPKPHTAMQWFPFPEPRSLRQKLRTLRRALAGCASVESESIRGAMLQAIIARGDSRLGEVLERVLEYGGGFSAWKRAFRDANLRMEDYLGAVEPEAELPWERVDVQVDRGFLLEEYRRFREGRLTPPCSSRCRRCGVC
ncbi:MAG: radical SAM protein [Euryarchaeota archaeon]|nr:radical SAM protein [Euryarchaeota archaeon]